MQNESLFETYEMRIPTWAMSYLINGDASGLEDYKIETVDNWLDETGFVSPIFESTSEHHFSSCPAFGMAGDVEDVTVYSRKAE